MSRKSDAAVILAEGEARGRLDLKQAAKAAGISTATYSRRKRNPGTITLDELRGFARAMKLRDDEIITLVRRG